MTENFGNESIPPINSSSLSWPVKNVVKEQIGDLQELSADVLNEMMTFLDRRSIFVLSSTCWSVRSRVFQLPWKTFVSWNPLLIRSLESAKILTKEEDSFPLSSKLGWRSFLAAKIAQQFLEIKPAIISPIIDRFNLYMYDSFYSRAGSNIVLIFRCLSIVCQCSSNNVELHG